MSVFENCIDYVLKNEGGFVDHPHDRGGATNFGITLWLLTSIRGTHITSDDVKNLTLDEARAIYKKYFWDELHLYDIVDDRIATALLDASVLRGGTSMVKTAQTACCLLGRPLQIDGQLGSATKAAINSLTPDKFLPAFASELLNELGAIVAQHTAQKVFFVGWQNRAHKMRTLIG